MSAALIDGKAIAGLLKEQLAKELEALTTPPHLVAIRANEDFGSKFYCASIQKESEALGIRFTLDQQPADCSQDHLLARIGELNADPDVTGVILQMPVPKGCDAQFLQAHIAPAKDAEGMCPANLGNVVLACSQPALLRRGVPDNLDEWVAESLAWPLPTPAPCTAVSSIELIRSTGIDLYGKHAVVVGHSEIVGKPLVLLLLAHFCTVTCCHIATTNLAELTRQADVLVVATGKPGAVWGGYSRRLGAWKKDPDNTPKPAVPDLSPLVTGDMVKPGAVVIDVATNRLPRALDANGEPVKNAKGRADMIVTGDVDFEGAKEVASHITPVPGGVGATTTALLLRNVVAAAKAAG